MANWSDAEDSGGVSPMGLVFVDPHDLLLFHSTWSYSKFFILCTYSVHVRMHAGLFFFFFSSSSYPLLADHQSWAQPAWTHIMPVLWSWPFDSSVSIV